MKDYKTLAETIYKRKSTREFSKTTADILENDVDLVKAFDIQPLIDSIKVNVKVLRKGEVNNGRSDYCIAFYSEEKPHYLENIGFIGQQIDLELQARGLGTCWWGMKKPSGKYKNIEGLSCVITMAAGCPRTTEKRTYPDGFKRNAIGGIFAGTLPDSRDSVPFRLIEAVRIAPSAVNLQPWIIKRIDNEYIFYLRPPKALMEKMIKGLRYIDMGIAMAHFMVQAKTDGLEVSFNFEGEDTDHGKFVASVLTTAG